MTKVTWIQIFATLFQLITSTAGTCSSSTPVGVRDELKIITDPKMTANSELSGFPPTAGRLAGTGAWCPNDSNSAVPHLEIDLGTKEYVVCAVEVQGRLGDNVTLTNFRLESSTDGTNFVQFQSGLLFTADEAGGSTAKLHNLSSSVTATHIRFKPENTSVCLRVEIYAVPVGVSVTCQEYNMLVTIDNALSQHNYSNPTTDLGLIDNNCKPTEDGNNITFDIILGQCQTELTLSKDEEKSFYRNSVKKISPTVNTEFDVICLYIRTPKTASETGSLTFTMDIYTDSGHQNAIPAAAVELGTKLYFKVVVQTTGSDIELHLKKCLATSTNDINDPVKHTFIENGCHVADDTFVTNYNCAATPSNSQTFELSVFRFAGKLAGSQVYFHCNALACLISSSASTGTCKAECDACSAGRKRRSADDSEQDPNEVHLVLGPFTIVNDEDDDDDDNDDDDENGGTEEQSEDSENFPTTLVVVACISGIVAIAIIIGLVVMMRLSKDSRGPAVKDVTADLAQYNLAFDDVDVKTLSIKSSGKTEEVVN